MSSNNIKKLSTIQEDGTHSSGDQQRHSFQIRFFGKPILCAHCRDYVWGEGHVGFGCVSCGLCVHNRCKIFLMGVNCPKNDAAQSTSLDANTKSTYYSVENWTINLVKEWLAVVNLHRYAEVFSTYNINGAKLLNLDIYQLYAFRIRDSYHHAAILQARDEIIYRSSMYNSYEKMLDEQEQGKSNLLKNQYKPENHHFLVHTLSKLTDCDMCHRPLLGIVHQCLMCQHCTLTCHRQCAFLGLPKCTSTNWQPDKVRLHYIFGVSLLDLVPNFDEKSANANDNVPQLLVKAFASIESRALLSNEDLYDVYRLSADTSKIDEIKQQINEKGVELVQLDKYDLNTVAAIVKTFLRDLQNSVIPEEMYDTLINRIQQMSTDELNAIVRNNVPPIHLACLKCIMAHLIRVWSYQFKVRGCHYLPDKLFHIFRSILVRPAWEKITQIVYNIDNQTLIIQRLMLECAWGVELPEYKIRPKRPNNPSLSLDRDSDYVNDSKRSTNVNSLRTEKSSCSAISDVYGASLGSGRRMSYNQECLNEAQWYWSDLSRDDTILILKNCPDGSFLVRNSSDRSQTSPYTLCVMKGTFVKSIKIFKQEQPQNGLYLYDIEKPCRFETVNSLVAYYSRVSLKEYNHNLDLVLTYGVSKYKFGKTTEWSIDKLYASFRDAFQEFQQMTKKYDDLESEIGFVREDLNQKKTAIDAFDKIIQMYRGQAEQVERILNEDLLKKTQAISSTRLLVSTLMPMLNSVRVQGESGLATTNDEDDDELEQTKRLMQVNKEKLEMRIKDLNTKKDDLKSDIDYLNTILTQLQEELDLLRPQLIELRKKRENYHMWLLQRGENDDKIQAKLKDETNVLTDEQNWSEDGSTTKTKTTLQKSSVSMQNLHKITESSDDGLKYAKPDMLKSDSINKIKDLAMASLKSASSALFQHETNPSAEAGSVAKAADGYSSSHLNSLNWYLPDCDREKAIELLKQRENGTYLVRPNLKQNSKYILSLVYENQVKHILIDENSSGCFIKPSSQRRLQSLNQHRPDDDRASIASSTTRARSPSISAYPLDLNSSYSTLNSTMSVGSISEFNDAADAASSSSSSTSSSNKSKEPTKFRTLTELVSYYAKNHIVVDNLELNTNLQNPALLNVRF